MQTSLGERTLATKFGPGRGDKFRSPSRAVSTQRVFSASGVRATRDLARTPSGTRPRTRDFSSFDSGDSAGHPSLRPLKSHASNLTVKTTGHITREGTRHTSLPPEPQMVTPYSNAFHHYRPEHIGTGSSMWHPSLKPPSPMRYPSRQRDITIKLQKRVAATSFDDDDSSVDSRESHMWGSRMCLTGEGIVRVVRSKRKL